MKNEDSFLPLKTELLKHFAEQCNGENQRQIDLAVDSISRGLFYHGIRPHDSETFDPAEGLRLIWRDSIREASILIRIDGTIYGEYQNFQKANEIIYFDWSHLGDDGIGPFMNFLINVKAEKPKPTTIQ